MIFLDFETRSLADLSGKTGVGEWVYSLHLTTLALCLAYSYSEDPDTVHIWAPWRGDLPFVRENLIVVSAPEEDPELEELLRRVVDGEKLCAHNAAFERANWENVCVRRWGWPRVPIEQWVCSMAVARAYGLPGGLDLAVKMLGLDVAKSSQKAMRRMMKPRSAWLNNGTGDPWFATPEDYSELCKYCQNDVAVEMELWRHLPPLTPREQRIFYLDARMNTRGVPVDRALAAGAWKVFDARRTRAAEQLINITKGAIETPNQTARIAAWASSKNVEMPDCQAGTVEGLLARDLPEDVRRVLEIRQSVGGAAPLKYNAFLNHCLPGDNVVRGELQYYGSHTGRWTSSGVQLHNAVKNKMDPAEAEKHIPAFYHPTEEEILEALEAQGLEDDQIDDILATLVRSVIKAPDGYTFIDVDYASIEARVMAWLAGDVALLHQFREYDRTGDPAIEPYRIAAADVLGIDPREIDKKQRAFGKVMILAPQYGMGAAKFLETCHRWGMTWVEPDLAERAIRKYRERHPLIKRYWYEFEARIKEAMACGHAWHHQAPIVYDRPKQILGIGLPNGRWLWYHRCKLVDDRIQYFGRLPPPKSGYGTVYSWGGKFTENYDQGLSRDYMALGMVGVDAIPGVTLLLTIHDELLMTVEKDRVDELLPQVKKAVMPHPLWTTGLPIDIGYWIGPRFKKD